MLNNGKNDLEKFDPRSDGLVFIRYSFTSKSYRIYNKRKQCVEESIHVVFDKAGGTNEGNTTGDNDSGNPPTATKKSDKGDNNRGSQGPSLGPEDESSTDLQNPSLSQAPHEESNPQFSEGYD